MIKTLIIFLLLNNAKQEMLIKYPSYVKQINQVGVPTVVYRDRAWFDRELKSFVLGKCKIADVKKQIQVVRNNNSNITISRTLHEMRHFVVFAAGLPNKENKIIDGH